MSAAMTRLAQRIRSLEVQLAAGRTPQLDRSSVVTSTGQDIGVVEGIEKGFMAGTVSEEAKQAAQEAYEAAHDIGPDQLREGAVTFGKVAAGAIGALALKADAIDGKVINGVEVNGGVVTGSTLRTSVAGARTSMRPGRSSLGYGNGVLEMWSGLSSEESPAEIYSIADGEGAEDNISLYMMSPKKAGYANRSFVQLFAADGNTSAEAYLAGDKVTVTGGSRAYLRSSDLAFIQGTNGVQLAAGVGDTERLNVKGGSLNFYVGTSMRFYVGGSMSQFQGDLRVFGSVISPDMRPLFAFAATGFVPPSAGTFTPETYAALTFTAPSSGTVKVTVAANIKASADGANARVGYEIRTGATPRAGTVQTAFDPNSAFVQYNAQYVGGSRISLVSGLTPGAEYNVYAVANCSAAGGDPRSTSLLVEPCL